MYVVDPTEAKGHLADADTLDIVDTHTLTHTSREIDCLRRGFDHLAVVDLFDVEDHMLVHITLYSTYCWYTSRCTVHIVGTHHVVEYIVLVNITW